jgi:hypothetical protein
MLCVIATVATAAACAGGPMQQEPTMTASETISVTSSAFRDGQPIPAEFTCDGPGKVPPLAWDGTPPDAAALALVVDDPDAPRGTFTHWVVLDLPPDTRELGPGALPPGAVQARNSGGDDDYYPPCPPSGTHHYRFTLFALNAPLTLAAGADRDAFHRALRGHVLARATLVGTFGSS